MKTFEKVEHTADIGIRAFGHNLTELFTNAAAGMMELLLDGAEISKATGHVINLKGKDLQELFVNLLEEILYLLNVKHFVTGSIRIHHLNKFKLSAQATGEPFNPDKHNIKYDIKGVTFHQLKFEKEGDLLTVRVIFDI